MMKYAKGTDQMGTSGPRPLSNRTKIWPVLNASPDNGERSDEQVPARGDMPALPAKRTYLRQE